jgi:YVTN family beta-propeller protein/autotransporter-associated beta strand protein
MAGGWWALRTGHIRTSSASEAGQRRFTLTLRRLCVLAGASLAALVALGCGGAQAQSGPFLYVPNFSSANVSVVDTSTNLVTGSAVAVGNGPRAAAVSGDESIVYVTNSGSNTVTPINTATNTAGTPIAVGSSPIGLAISPDGKTIYVANDNSNTVTPIDTATNTAGPPIVVGFNPFGVAITPDGKTVYVTNSTTNTVTPFNTATNTAGTPITVGFFPAGLAVTPDGKTVYVANQFNNTVTPINTATNTAGAPIAVGSNPVGVAVSPDGKTVYVANAVSDTVTPINTATNTAGAPIPVGNTPIGIAVSPDGKTVYVTNENSNNVTPIDIATNTAGTPIPVGSTPFFSPGICSNGNALLASGLTFKANTSGALACTMASGPTGSPGPIFTGGTMRFAGAGITSSLPITLMSQGGTFDTAGNNATLSGTISGTGGLIKVGLGTLTLSGVNAYAGATVISGGTLAGGAANTFSAASATTINTGGTLDLGGFAQTINAVTLAGGALQNGALTGAVTSTGGTIFGLGGSASLTTTSGTTLVLGTNTYAGPTTVNGGILDVIGSITDPTINSGGTLTGTGTVGTTQVNSGGIFAPGSGVPGSSMTIAGNLAFQSGAIYLVQVNPATASFATVTGTAALGGATVNAIFAGGSYISKRYTILTASGGVSGTFAPTVVNTNLPSNFHTTLSYDADDAYLNLILTFAIPGGLNGNQQAVGNALTNFFSSTGSIPLLYSALNAAGLTQASGESATGSQQTTFQAMSQFINLLTDPFMGRGNPISGSGNATPYAEESASAYAASRKPADAFAMFTKAPPVAFVPRWSVWAAGYGGSQSTSGNAIVGSNDTTSRIAGTAVGADYLFSPDTLAGFALAGGGTSFGVNNLGSGRSDLFQAGAYVRHTEGAAYITGALAYGWQDITTNRTVSIAGIDQLRAEFNANAYSGRVEGGYRFVAPLAGGVGITPYAAGQFTTFDLPAYAEGVVSGAANFALAYAAKSVTDSRSELGIRTDKSFAVTNGVLTLRSRFAWAHDFDPDRAIAATFQALPGASFVVNGAAQAPDSALTTASAEMKWMNGWSAAATFEGEFSSVTTSYAGKGVVRYAW